MQGPVFSFMKGPVFSLTTIMSFISNLLFVSDWLSVRGVIQTQPSEPLVLTSYKCRSLYPLAYIPVCKVNKNFKCQVIQSLSLIFS